nr:hypothetical protein [Sinorhizobium medicae]
MAVHAVLNPSEGLSVDKRLVMPHAAGNAPFGSFDKSSIDGLAQQLEHAMVQHASLAREERVVAEEAHNVRLRLEPPRGVAFKRFLHDSRFGLMADEHLAASAHALVPVADRRLENEVSILDARLHTVLGLLAVFLTLVL